MVNCRLLIGKTVHYQWFQISACFCVKSHFLPLINRLFPPFFLPFSPCEASGACFLVRKNGFELRKYGVENRCL